MTHADRIKIEFNNYIRDLESEARSKKLKNVTKYASKKFYNTFMDHYNLNHGCGEMLYKKYFLLTLLHSYCSLKEAYKLGLDFLAHDGYLKHLMIKSASLGFRPAKYFVKKNNINYNNNGNYCRG